MDHKATGTVDEKGIDYKDETMSVNGTVYTQSGIGYLDLRNTVFYADVTDGHTEYTYDLYLDHFGYVRLFAESAYNNGFALLTDGYYWTDNRDETFQATIYDRETDELVDVDVAAGRNATDAEYFIDTYEGDYHGDKGTWDRLWEADLVYNKVYNTSFLTNVAAFVASDGVYTLSRVQDASNRVAYEAQELRTAGVELDDELLYATNDSGRVQTRTSTVYYLVIRNGAGTAIVDILTWTGYRNVPAEAELGTGTVAYAVTHESTAGYDLADVVIFETNTTADKDTYFVYEDNNWNIEYVYGIGYDEDNAIVDGMVNVDLDHSKYAGEIEFYEIDKDGKIVTHINDHFASYNIYAGWVNVIDDTTKWDYVQVTDTAAGNLYFTPEEGSPDYAPVYEVYVTSKGDYNVRIVDDWADRLDSARLILFTDGSRDNNVEYAILAGYETAWATMSTMDDLTGDLYSLYTRIMIDANTEDPTELEEAIAAAEALITKEGENWTEAEKAEADTLAEILKSYEDSVMATEALEDLSAEITAYETAQGELGTAKTAALAELAEIYNELENAEAYEAYATYKAAQDAINAAKDEAAVDAALAAGIVAVQAYNADADTDADLAGALVDAGLDLDDVVAALLAEELTADEIRAALYAGRTIGMDDVIPALVANDVAAADIYDAYLGAGKTIDEVTDALVAEELTTSEVIEGYLGYYAENTTGTVEGLEVSYANGAMQIAVENPSADHADAISGTGFGQLLMALTENSIKWVSKNTTTGESWDHTDTVGALKTDILAVCGKLDEGNWQIDAYVDDEVAVSFVITASK